MRGQTVYDRRGIPLALPNGTLENPALRFPGERMGLYRQAAGRLGIGINRFRAVEVAETDTFIRSNSPGATSVVSPLAIARANATTANLQETAFDVYEIGAPVARMAAYRESSTRWGWKLYGFNGGTPVELLEAAGTGRVTIPGALTVGGPVTLNGSLSLAGGAALDPPIGIGGAGVAAILLSLYPTATFTTGIRQGATSNHAIILQNTAPNVASTARGVLGFAPTGGPLGGGANSVGLYTEGTAAGDLLLGRGADLRLGFFDADTLFLRGGLESMRLTSTGVVGIGTASPQGRLHVAGPEAAVVVSPQNATPTNTYLQLMNHPVSGSATRFLQWGLTGVVNAFMGGTAVGDAAMVTLGTGRLVMGSASTAKLILDANSAGVQVMHGGAELMRITNGGNVGINTPTPTSLLQVRTSGAGTGLTVVAPSFASVASPLIALYESPSDSTRQALLGLALAAGHFSAPNVGDFFVHTGGTNGGRLVLGTRSVVRLIIGVTGNVSIGNSVEGAARLNIFAAANTWGNGLRLYHSDNNSFWEFFNDNLGRLVAGCNGTSRLFFNGGNGYLTLGPSATDIARLHIVQPSTVSSEGLVLSFGGVYTHRWLDDNFWSRWNMSGNSGVALIHGSNYFCPPSDQSTNLGHPNYRWPNLYSVHGQFDGNVVVAGGVTVTNLQVNSNAGVNGNLNVGATTTTAALTASNASVPGTLTVGQVNASGSINATGAVNGGSGTINGMVFGGGNFANAAALLPSGDHQGTVGQGGRMWFQMYCHEAYKPGGGDWQTVSDRRTKVASAERPYERGLTELLQLRPVRYRYNGSYGMPKGGEYAGFRAEDLQAVVPEMVGTLRVPRTYGDDDEDELLTVDTSDLKLMLLNAIRELAERLAAVERKVA